MKKRAFTLAELLIAMVILGVIAALTLPSLLQIHQQAGAGALLSKIQATIEDATGRIIVENPDEALDAGTFEDKLKNYLMMKKSNSSWKLKDGTTLAFSETHQPVPANAGEGFRDIDVDLNGKGWPNKFGVDKFSFVLSSEGFLYPLGCAAKMASNNWKPDKDYDAKSCEMWNRCPGTVCNPPWALGIKKCACYCAHPGCSDDAYEVVESDCTCKHKCRGKDGYAYNYLLRSCKCNVSCNPATQVRVDTGSSCYCRAKTCSEMGGTTCGGRCYINEPTALSQCNCISAGKKWTGSSCEDLSCTDKGGEECGGKCYINDPAGLAACKNPIPEFCKNGKVCGGNICSTEDPTGYAKCECEKNSNKIWDVGSGKCRDITCADRGGQMCGNKCHLTNDDYMTCKCAETNQNWDGKTCSNKSCAELKGKECGGDCYINNETGYKKCDCEVNQKKEWVNGKCLAPCDGTRYGIMGKCCPAGKVVEDGECLEPCDGGTRFYDGKCCPAGNEIVGNSVTGQCVPKCNGTRYGLDHACCESPKEILKGAVYTLDKCVEPCDGERLTDGTCCPSGSEICLQKCYKSGSKELSKCRCRVRGLGYDESKNMCKADDINCYFSWQTINPSTGLCEGSFNDYCDWYTGNGFSVATGCKVVATDMQYSFEDIDLNNNRFLDIVFGFGIDVSHMSMLSNSNLSEVGAEYVASWGNDAFKEAYDQVILNAKVKVVEGNKDDYTSVPSGYDAVVIKIGDKAQVVYNQKALNQKVYDIYIQKLRNEYNSAMQIK